MRISEFAEEEKVIKAAHSSQHRVIMVIGGSDSGKTTFIEGLADHLSRRTEVGMIDLDMGQSHIGPPTTVAWGKIRGGFKSWQDITVKDFYFTGSLSPVGNLLPAVTGAGLITEKALLACDKVIIDTTGLVNEPDGRVLKQCKIDLLKPDLIISFEHKDELKHILKSFAFQKMPNILRLPVLKRTGTKSTDYRSRYRMDRFRAYFENSKELTVSLENTGIKFTREPVRLTHTELQNRLISFRNAKNMDTALGIIMAAHTRKRTITVRTPMKKYKKISSMVIGKIHVNL